MFFIDGILMKDNVDLLRPCASPIFPASPDTGKDAPCTDMGTATVTFASPQATKSPPGGIPRRVASIWGELWLAPQWPHA
jgi:hypothetical protein